MRWDFYNNTSDSDAKSKGKIKKVSAQATQTTQSKIKAADPGKEVVGSGDGLDGGSVWPGERRIFGSFVFLLFKTLNVKINVNVNVKVKVKFK
jgi:hypothetical protein